MSLSFVSTSVLSSENGIDFNKEIVVESAEVTKARNQAAAAAAKPLYEQLAELKDKKQVEYDENTKKIFAPPKSLDVEDVQFFNDLDAAKIERTNQARRKDDEALEAFREARKGEFLKENKDTRPVIAIHHHKRESTSIKVGAIVTAKRKVADSNDHTDKVKSQKTDALEVLKTNGSHNQELKPSSTGLFTDYGSDSD